AHLAANPRRHAMGPGGIEDALQESQDRRAQPVVALGQTRVRAVGGEQELGAAGKLLVALARPFDLLFEQRPRLLILPRFGDHWEHYPEHPAARSFDE